MQIFVKTFTNYTMTLDVDPSDTVYNLKLKIQHRTDVHPGAQHLIYASIKLQDDMTLNDYKIVGNSTIHLNGTFQLKE